MDLKHYGKRVELQLFVIHSPPTYKGFGQLSVPHF